MAIQDIPVGSAPNDGNGVPLRDAFITINANFQYLLKPLRWDISDLSGGDVSASLRGDGTGNLGLYVGAAGASDGAQTKAAAINKTNGKVALGGAPAAHRLAVYGGATGGVITFATSGSTAFEIYNSGVDKSWSLYPLTNGSNSDLGLYSNSGTPGTRMMIQGASGNVGIGTNNPAQPLQVTRNGPVSIACEDASVGRYAYLSYGGSYGYIGASGASNFSFQLNGADQYILTVNDMRPATDNLKSSGVASNRWSVVYAGTGTINTSDAHEKVTPDGEEITEASGWGVTPPTEAELRVSRRIAAALGWFKFKDAVAEKGLEGARKHFGLTVQFALDICADEGVDPWSIGIFCRDQITRRAKVTQTVIEQQKRPAEPTLVIEVIDGIPTQVWREQPDLLVYDLRQVIGIDGKPVMQTVIVENDDGEPEERTEPLLHPVPVMVQIEREEWVDEPAGERLGFRPDQLALFLIAGCVS